MAFLPPHCTPLLGLWLSLCVLLVLVREVHGEDPTSHQIGGGSGGSQCGDYSNQVMEDGMCRLVATLPQTEDQRCPDMFRCTDEVSYWLHENEERKQQILSLRETISELQEELRNHRHRVKVLELQQVLDPGAKGISPGYSGLALLALLALLHHVLPRSEEKNRINSSLENRFHELETHYAEATTLVHLQGTLIYDLQAQIHNLSRLVESVRRNPGCMINIVGTSPQMSSEEALHPEVQHVRNCPIDCASIYYNGVRRSGLYTVVPSLGAMPVEVYCDMETEGGGWTMLQRRVDGSVTFDRSWREYKDGFGDLHSEFWLGNDHIHDLTSQGDYSLRIDLEDWSNKHKHALYESFSVDGEDSQYCLHVSGFSGTTEDSFSWYHDKQGFSTPDTGNICAEISHGGWWYNQCFYANLNGVYYRGGRYSPKGKNPLGPDGIVWYSWKDSDYYSLRKVSMMIRPRTFRPRMSP
ncbi:unnamed protein product [Coregonus sp. 'balchen']|nr:unnamed protein product [Coregonus sp. 'balchen']